MNEQTQQLTIPPPDEIEHRIKSYKDEIKALSRLLRMSRAAQEAEHARARARAIHGAGRCRHEIAFAEKPLTLRSLMYRLVSAGWLPSTDKVHYTRLAASVPR